MLYAFAHYGIASIVGLFTPRGDGNLKLVVALLVLDFSRIVGLFAPRGDGNTASIGSTSQAVITNCWTLHPERGRKPMRATATAADTHPKIV